MIEFDIPDAEMEQLLGRFAHLTKKAQNEIAFESVFEATQPLVEAVRDAAPVNEDPHGQIEGARAGSLKQSIGVVMRKKKRGRGWLAVVGPVRGMGKGGAEPANYAHLVEYGHRVAHAKTGKLNRKSDAAPHGEVPAHPFMRPSWEATKGVVLANLRRLLGAKIEGAAKASGSK